MDFDALRAAVVPGDGVVGRWPGLVCVADCADRAVLRRLLDVCAGTAGPDPGRTLARRLAMWLGGPDAPKADLRFGTVAITGDQWAVFLFGSVGLVVPESGIELSGAHAATWTDRLLARQATPGVLVLEGSRVPSDLVDGVHDLRSGVVPGAGAVLVHSRRSAGGDSAEEVASRSPADSAWPDLNDVPVELERSPWNLSDAGPTAGSRAGNRRSADLSADDSPAWHGMLGGSEALDSDVLGAELLGPDIGDARGGSATGRTASGSISGAWPGLPAGARRAGAERPGGTPPGARRGRAGRVGAGRSGLGANGSVLRAVGSHDFALPESGGSADGERDDESDGRAGNDAPPGAGPSAGAAVREADEDNVAVDSRASAEADVVGLGPDRSDAERKGADRSGGDRRNGAEAGKTCAGEAATRSSAAVAGRADAGHSEPPGARTSSDRTGSDRHSSERSSSDSSAGARSATGRSDRADTASTASRAAEPQRPPARADSDGADAERRGPGSAGSRGGGAGSAAPGGAGTGRAPAAAGADQGRPATDAGDSRGAGQDRTGQGRAAAANAAAGGNGDRAATGRAVGGSTGTSGADKGRGGPGTAGADRSGPGRGTANRARADDPRGGGAAPGGGPNGAGATGAGPGRAGSGTTGAGSAGSNGAVVNGAGSNGAGPNGAGSSGAGTNGSRLNGAGSNGAAPATASSGGAAAGRASDRKDAGRSAPDRDAAGRGNTGQLDPRRTTGESAGRAAKNGAPRNEPGKNGAGQNPAGQNPAGQNGAAPNGSGRNGAGPNGPADGAEPGRGAGEPGGTRDPGADEAAPGGLAPVAKLVPRNQGRDDATGAESSGSGVASVHPLAPDSSRRRANGGSTTAIQSDAWFAAASDVAEADAAPRGSGPRHGRPEEDKSAGRAASATGTSKVAAVRAQPESPAEQTQLQVERVPGVVPPEPSKQPARSTPTGDAAAEEAGPGGADAPQVRGHLCPRGHLNDPRSQSCLTCGVRVEDRGGALVSGPRPSLGTLIFDDGATHSVDSDYLVGRMPEADPRVRAGSLRSLLVEDPSGAVSRAHAEIRVNGWDVLLVDSGSRNGTFVAGPGESAWTALPPRQSRWLVAGTRVRLGGRTFLFEAPPGVR